MKYGLITVDGAVALDPGMHVDPDSAIIEVEGVRLNYRKFIYIMMNKPAGVISATTDNRQKTVLEILPDEYRCFDLFPAGRLDIDTEGLLLLTNDGQLAHDILSPRKHVPKRYYALIDGLVGDREVKLFKEGVILDDGYKTLPAELTVIRQGMRSEIELVLHEGKFHQVKRMFEAAGSRVTYLKRIAMGGLMLDEGLGLGQCRELLPEEVELLKQRLQTELDEDIASGHDGNKVTEHDWDTVENGEEE
jgi:16S rRNA pseudouridine516 synthase